VRVCNGHLKGQLQVRRTRSSSLRWAHRAAGSSATRSRPGPSEARLGAWASPSTACELEAASARAALGRAGAGGCWPVTERPARGPQPGSQRADHRRGLRPCLAECRGGRFHREVPLQVSERRTAGRVPGGALRRGPTLGFMTCPLSDTQWQMEAAAEFDGSPNAERGSRCRSSH
jgi:hypothetical protein